MGNDGLWVVFKPMRQAKITKRTSVVERGEVQRALVSNNIWRFGRRGENSKGPGEEHGTEGVSWKPVEGSIPRRRR